MSAGSAAAGIELEALARPVAGLNLGGSVTYLDARITDFPLAQCYTNQTAAQGCIPAGGGLPAHQDLSGARPAQAPKWKLSANLDYAQRLGTLPVDGVVTAALTYQSRINYSLNQNPYTVQPGYATVNLAIGVRQPDHRYEVMLFVNNLFNKHYFQNLTNSSGNYGGLLAIQSYLPRDFARYAGVRASVGF